MAYESEVRKRISSVELIKKITKVMKLISASKIQKIKKIFETYKEYHENVYIAIQKIVANNNNNQSSLYTNEIPKEDEKNIWILISSDMGFCGYYNNSLLKIFQKNFNRDKDIVFVLGKKAASHLKRNDYQIFNEYVDFHENITLDFIRSIVGNIIFCLKEKNFNCVKIIYSEFISQSKTEEKFEQIIPIKKNNQYLFDKKNLEFSPTIIYEPEFSVMIESLIFQYLVANLFYCLTVSKLSEFTIRRNTMENATDNANEIIENLKILANKIRQEKITREITEIISGQDN
ncbi:ATP synthase F1 subunit gamma [symbiont of Argiope bruennichi]|uniref:ATP synthase F1 subunit gamma n=1 Tax=symbiont of Argiope bruennichi TaxID=2810479 RepID=UPI003DA3AAF8